MKVRLGTVEPDLRVLGHSSNLSFGERRALREGRRLTSEVPKVKRVEARRR